ncbi:MAG: hypothetical protein IJ037_01085 [Clostridia bacterium]|nr:hypothetical protein [Clostridia bacterium]MBQ8370800.1 hypothetical protein [Clostridia bacterium]
MNNGKTAFRSALGGYNREDVNAYIKETDLRHAAETEELNQALAKAQAESERQKEAAQAAEVQLNAVRAQSNADMIAASELTKAKDGEIAELTKRLNLLKAETDAQANVINSLREEKSALSAQLSEAKNAAESEKKAADDRIKAVRAEYEAQLADAKNGQETVMALHAENEALTATLNEAVEESMSLRQNAETLSGRIAELEAQLSAALEDIVKKNDELTAKDAEIAALTDAHEQALAQCVHKALGDVTDRGSDAYKLDMYDKVSSQLGDILIGANRNADEIIASAKEESEKLRTEAAIDCEQKRAECDAAISRTKSEVEEEAAYIRERLSIAAEDLLSGVSSDLHASTENCLRELSGCIEDMQYEIRSLLSRLTSRSAEMNDRIDYYQSCVSDGIGVKLKEMDDKYGIRHMTPGNADGESDVHS